MVIVGFDGTGDSGQIEGVDAYVEEVVTPLPDAAVPLAKVPWNGDDIEVAPAPLAEALEAVAYALLEAGHDGWENNEGAFGEFIFEVGQRSIRLDFNQRI